MLAVRLGKGFDGWIRWLDSMAGFDGYLLPISSQSMHNPSVAISVAPCLVWRSPNSTRLKYFQQSEVVFLAAWVDGS
jgi:hypothetical protein